MCTGLSPSMVQLSRSVPLIALTIMSVLQPHCSLNCSGLGYSAFARHYLRNHYCFLFLRLLRCFSSPGLPPVARVTGLQPAGFSHSEICGLHWICQSPQLIAAYHVLHRLWEPRHPPYALTLAYCTFCYISTNNLKDRQWKYHELLLFCSINLLNN